MPADARFDPRAILRALNEHGVRYVVVGGFAVAAHGVVRATVDLDVVVDPSWDNTASLVAALEQLDARDVGEPELPLTQEALVRRADRRFVTSFGELHVLHEVSGVPRYRDLAPGDLIDIDGDEVRVATLSDLRAMKRAAGRDKDRVDLAELDALHGAS